MACKQRNAAVGKPRFPVELHARIIGESVGPYGLPLVRLVILSQVCIGWWKLIRETPELWTDVRTSSEAAELALQRSKNLPLDVRLEDPGRLYSWRYPDRHNWIVSQKHRWQSVAVETKDQATLAWLLDEEPLPYLKFGDIRYITDFDHKLDKGSLPGSSLRESRIRGVRIDGWSSMYLGCLESLEIANIRVNDKWGAELVEVLSSSPRLEKVYITGIVTLTASGGSAFPAPSFHLNISSLKSLSLGDMHLPILLQLLPSFHGPQLQHFHLGETHSLDGTAALNAMVPSSDASPSLLISVINNRQVSTLHLLISDTRVELRDSLSSVESLQVIIPTQNLSNTIAQLAFMLDPAKPMQIHVTASQSILPSAHFLDNFPKPTHITISNALDAIIILRHIAIPGNAAPLLEVKFDWNSAIDADQFAQLVQKVKEVLWSRPRLRVSYLGLDEFCWGMRAFAGTAIPLDWWIDGYTPPGPEAEGQPSVTDLGPELELPGEALEV